MMHKLSDKDIQERLNRLGGWCLQEGRLIKRFDFKDFKEAMAFVTRVALIAEPLDHHPDIDIRYSKVTLKVVTHSAGGITDKDFDLAAQIDS